MPNAHTTILQLHCAALCGVDDAVLARAADVLSARAAGVPVRRLALPSLQARDEEHWRLVRALAGLNLADAAALQSLLLAALGAEAGSGGDTAGTSADTGSDHHTGAE